MSEVSFFLILLFYSRQKCFDYNTAASYEAKIFNIGNLKFTS